MLRLLPNKIIAHDAVASPLFRLFFCRLLFFILLYKKEDPKFLINQLFFFLAGDGVCDKLGDENGK